MISSRPKIILCCISTILLLGIGGLQSHALASSDKEANSLGANDITIDDMLNLYQPYAKNITPYEPIYFLLGTSPEKSKFQISLKFRPIEDDGSLAQNHPWVRGIHFAFTQTSFWNLGKSSTPFEDTSYKPEIFWVSGAKDQKGKSGNYHWEFLQLGLQHESNGRGEGNSRSTNYLYTKPIFTWYNEHSQLGIMVAPKIWLYVGNDNETNKDLKDYRGYFDLEVKLGKANSFVLGTSFRSSKRGCSFQADFTYPLSRYLVKNFGIYFHAQYTNSLGESLIEYQKRTEALRLGFSIVR